MKVFGRQLEKRKLNHEATSSRVTTSLFLPLCPFLCVSSFPVPFDNWQKLKGKATCLDYKIDSINILWNFTNSFRYSKLVLFFFWIFCLTWPLGWNWYVFIEYVVCFGEISMFYCSYCFIRLNCYVFIEFVVWLGDQVIFLCFYWSCYFLGEIAMFL